MVDKKITELCALTCADCADVIAIVDLTCPATTKKITLTNLFCGRGGAQTPWASNIDAAEFNLTDVGLLRLNKVNTTGILEIEANHTTPANGNSIGQIDFIDDSSTGVRRTYGKILSRIEDPTNTGEDGEMIFSIIKGGANDEYISLNEGNGGTIRAKATLSIDNSNLYFNSSITRITADTNGFEIRVDSNDDIDFNTGATTFAKLDGAANSLGLASQGGISFDNTTLASGTQTIISDAGGLTYTVPAGDTHDFDITGTGTIMSIGAGTIDLDDTVNLTWATGQTITAGFSGFEYSSPSGDTHNFNINGVQEFRINTGGVSMINTASHLFDMERSGELLNGDIIGEIRFRAEDGEAAPVIQNYARITAEMDDDTLGAEDGALHFYVTETGTHDVEYMDFNSADTGRINVYKNINYENGEGMQWAGSPVRRLVNSTSGFIFGIETGDDFEFQVNSSPIARLDSNGFGQATGAVIGFDNATPASATQKIVGDAGGLTYTVPACDTHDFVITGTGTVGTIETTGFNEGGVPISPIGTQQFFIPANAWKPTATSGAAGLTTRELGASCQNIEAMEFTYGAGACGTDSKAYYNFVMPQNWNGGTITFRYIWFREDDQVCGTPESKTSNFTLRGGSLSNTCSFGGACFWGCAVAVSDTSHTCAAENREMESCFSGNVTIGGSPADGDLISLELSRDTSAGTIDGSIYIIGVMIEYTTDAAVSTG